MYHLYLQSDGEKRKEVSSRVLATQTLFTKLNFIHFSCAAGAEKFLGKCKQLLLIL